MKTLFGRLIFVGVLFASNLITQASPITISVDTKSPGAAIPQDFTGLSFEVALLLPGENGIHYFRPGNLPLLNLFRTLGVKNVRIGGNTSDRDVRRLPADADFDSLFAFAKAAGVKVIYCLRLHNGDPQADAATVKYIMSRYAAQVDCFSIGQEPTAYPVGKTDTRPNSERMGAANEKYQYSAYREEWKKFADVIIAAEPDVRFCGPSVHNNADWAQRFMTDFGQSNHVTLITEHLYPGGAGGKVPTPEIGRDWMLSDKFTAAYERLHKGFAPQAIASGLPYRLEEVNNYFNGGATNVSNTFASALWGLDFMYWWAEHGAAGLNFHTGDRVAAGAALQPSRYTAYYSTTNGYMVRPLGYGIKTFELGSHGKLVPATISNPESLNLSAYAVLGDDRNLYLTIINKEHGSAAREASISISVPQGAAASTHRQMILLSAPNNDIAATDGQRLGGASIQHDGSWNGSWSPLDSAIIKVPAGSAVVLKLPTR